MPLAEVMSAEMLVWYESLRGELPDVFNLKCEIICLCKFLWNCLIEFVVLIDYDFEAVDDICMYSIDIWKGLRKAKIQKRINEKS